MWVTEIESCRGGKDTEKGGVVKRGDLTWGDAQPSPVLFTKTSAAAQSLEMWQKLHNRPKIHQRVNGTDPSVTWDMIGKSDVFDAEKKISWWRILGPELWRWESKRPPKSEARVGLSILSGLYDKWFEDGTLVKASLLPPLCGRGGATLWAMFCLETLRSSICVGVYFTRTTYSDTKLKRVQDHLHQFDVASVVGQTSPIHGNGTPPSGCFLGGKYHDLLFLFRHTIMSTLL